MPIIENSDMAEDDLTEDDGLIASWEAALLPNWEWEAYEKTEDGLYYGRVQSPQSYGRWEWGYFSAEQLSKAGAYRTDLDPDDDEPLLPDGGYAPAEEAARLFETELDALEYLDGDED